MVDIVFSEIVQNAESRATCPCRQAADPGDGGVSGREPRARARMAKGNSAASLVREPSGELGAAPDKGAKCE
jgi:hypothetical protein